LAIRPSSEAVGTGWQSADDAALLAASVRRDARAFGVLVQRYHRDVFRVVWRLSKGAADAEDIAQEAFLRLWANPAQIREARALKGWLLRVGSNLVMDRYRRRPEDDLDAAGEIADAAPDPSEQLELADVSQTVDAAVAQLPDRQRQALVLVHFEHMSNIAAAAVMELSVDALESLLARARRRLKELLEPKGRELLQALERE